MSCHVTEIRRVQCMFGFAQVVGHVDYPEWCQGSVHAEKVP